MAIRASESYESMNAAELETALGVPGAATSWDAFGPLMLEHRICLFATNAWGQGNGVANKPGWGASALDGAKVIIDQDPLLAGCKVILMKIAATGGVNE